MLTTLIIAGAVFGVLMLGMAIGVVSGRTKLQGSCGGVAGKDGCDVCGGGACETDEAKPSQQLPSLLHIKKD